MLAVAGLLALFNFATSRYLDKNPAVTELELMLQLLVDVFALTVVLGLSGGASNPFVGMYLPLLTLAAVWLPSAYTWIVGLATFACYSAIAFWFRPLVPEGDEAGMASLLVAGRCLNYAFSAGTIAFFTLRIAKWLREDERLLAATRERELSNEHVVRTGTLAVGAAHELSSPLCAMAIMLDETKAQSHDPVAVRANLDVLSVQLAACRETLGLLLSFGGATLATDQGVVEVDRFARDIVHAFGSCHPHASVRIAIDTPGRSPTMRVDPCLRQALRNLLCNAADVSPDAIELRLNWDDQFVRIVVRDRGPGIRPEIEKQVGSLFFTTKEDGKGNGLGLYLAHTALTRLGGSLRIGNAVGGGACAEICLPVAEMAPLDIDRRERR
jgi:two-component system sensor histidine kinase RegB